MCSPNEVPSFFVMFEKSGCVQAFIYPVLQSSLYSLEITLHFIFSKMSCNSYVFNTECTEERRILPGDFVALFTFSLSGFKLITIYF